MLLYIGIYVSANFRYCDTSELMKTTHYSAKLQSVEGIHRTCDFVQIVIISSHFHNSLHDILTPNFTYKQISLQDSDGVSTIQTSDLTTVLCHKYYYYYYYHPNLTTGRETERLFNEPQVWTNLIICQ